MKVTPIIYEKIRAKHPELRLPMWPELRSEDKKRAKRLTVDKLIVFRHMQLLARDPDVSDRVQVISGRQANSWQRNIAWIGNDPVF